MSFKLGQRVSWKVANYPDATGIVVEEADSDGLILIDSTAPGEEGGMILLTADQLTAVLE